MHKERMAGGDADIHAQTGSKNGGAAYAFAGPEAAGTPAAPVVMPAGRTARNRPTAQPAE